MDTTVNLSRSLNYRQPGLGSVPQGLLHLREGAGLAGPAWNALGKDWHALAALWLRAEVLLGKTGRLNLSFPEIRSSSLPQALQDWLNCRLLLTDSAHPPESFGNAFTTYLKQLPWDTMTKGDAVLDQIWCRPGKTGIIVFLVGLYWQSEYSGAGNAWSDNMTLVNRIFHAILDAPTL